MTETDWFYSLGDGRSNGPITLNELRKLIAAGRLTADTVVWHESLGNWTSVASVPALASARNYIPKPPPVPPPFQTQNAASNSFDSFVDKARESVESIGAKALAPPSTEIKADTWGAVGSIAGAFSAGLLFVGLCFTPMACCAVPVSIGGIVSALFSDNKRLRMIGLVGNSIVLFLSLAIVIWLSFSMAMALKRFDR